VQAAERRRRLVRKARAAGIDAMLVTRPEDVGYLSGFTGADSWLLVVGRGSCLITDGRFREQAGRECGDIEVYVRTRGLAPSVAAVLKGRGVRRLGVQSDHMTLAQREALGRVVSSRRIRPVGPWVPRLRQTKDPGEVGAIRRAVGVAERAFQKLVAGGRKGFVGRSERQIAAELDYLMRLEGADAPAFETIVAAGAHGSLPHYRPGRTRIRSSQAVLIDFGAVADGYCSDLTRVVFVDTIPAKLAGVYDVVRRAHAAAVAATRPGVRCCDVDAAARAVIEAAGYGDRFVHSLGHGLGRAVHEGPALGRRVSQRLRAGMVVTIEPGIYLPGIGGIRIEDDVLICPRGRRKLSSLPLRAADLVLR